MTTHELDAAELAEVVPGDVADYLAAHGWRLAESVGSASTWRRSVDDHEVELLLPERRELRDYPVRIAELVTSVAAIERRSRDDVLHALRFPLIDVQYGRTQPETPPGSTTLRDGYHAIRGVRDLFLAAASTAFLRYRQPVLPRTKPPEAMAFLERARLGQTGKGSYVISVETPVIDPTGDSPGTRDVLLHLYGAVRSARDAASESLNGAGPVAFERQVSEGVSANLCGALADIGGLQRNDFTLSFTWAARLPPPTPTPDLEFGEPVIRSLKEGGRHLETVIWAHDASITGRVVELRRQRRRDIGSVIVEGSLQIGQSQERRRLAVQLAAYHYEQAVQAHRDEHFISVSGILRTVGREPRLTEIRSFELLQRPDR